MLFSHCCAFETKGSAFCLRGAVPDTKPCAGLPGLGQTLFLLLWSNHENWLAVWHLAAAVKSRTAKNNVACFPDNDFLWENNPAAPGWLIMIGKEMVSKNCHRPVPQSVLPPPLESCSVIRSFEIFALKKIILSLDCHIRCPASRCLLTAHSAVCLHQIVVAEAEMRCHKEFGHFKYRHASVCTNMTQFQLLF